MRLPRGEDRETRSLVAAEDASHLSEQAAAGVDKSVGIEWYEQHGSEVDRAARNLCLLRRAQAGAGGSPQHGDEAVRQVLGLVSTPALLWIASRAFSYMDEHGFPEAVEPWFRDEPSPLS